MFLGSLDICGASSRSSAGSVGKWYRFRGVFFKLREVFRYWKDEDWVAAVIRKMRVVNPQETPDWRTVLQARESLSMTSNSK